MDSNVLGGILRAIVPAFVAFVVAKGWITPASTTGFVDAIVVGVPAIAAAVWSIFTNAKSA